VSDFPAPRRSIRALLHEIYELKRFQTAKVTLKFIQEHWQWCQSIGHLRFLVTDPLQQCLYLAPLTRYYNGLCNSGHANFKGCLLSQS